MSDQTYVPTYRRDKGRHTAVAVGSNGRGLAEKTVRATPAEKTVRATPAGHLALVLLARGSVTMPQ